MHQRRIPLLAGTALALATLMGVAAVQPAEAKRPRRVVKVRLLPAHQRPDYVGAPGYAGGPAGPAIPAVIDPAIGYPNGYDPGLVAGLALPQGGDAGLLGGGGFLGTGVLPQTGVLGGVPVVGAFGL